MKNNLFSRFGTMILASTLAASTLKADIFEDWGWEDEEDMPTPPPAWQMPPSGPQMQGAPQAWNGNPQSGPNMPMPQQGNFAQQQGNFPQQQFAGPMPANPYGAQQMPQKSWCGNAAQNGYGVPNQGQQFANGAPTGMPNTFAPQASVNGPNGAAQFNAQMPNGVPQINSNGPTAGPAGVPNAGGQPPMNANPAATANIPVEQFDAGFFRMMKPRGWQVIPMGSGTGLALVVRDPQNPARQFFMISSCTLIGTEQAKQMMVQAQQYSMQPIDLSDAPVISDMTPSGFLRGYNAIARMRLTQQTYPQVPEIANVQITSTEPMQSPFQQFGAQCELLRARCTERGVPCEGVFSVAVTRYSMADIGNAAAFYGVIAPAGELSTLEPLVRKCWESFQFSPQYLQEQNQLQQQQFALGQQRYQAQQQQFAAGQRAHQTRMETYDIQNKTWQAGQDSQDLRHRMWMDTMSGVERMVDPSTNQTYWVNNGDYQNYDMNRNQFQMNNLQQVPYDRQHLNMLNQYAQNGYTEIK